MSYFAQPVLGRDQLVLIPRTLHDVVSEKHEVRILDEILQTMDWSGWVGEYCQVRGQPPIHPRILAAVILYGMTRRIRSSRVLEYMTGHNIDFMWLTEGRTIDHTTICKFRKRFKKQLRELFCQVGRFAMNMGVIRLGEVTFDGTRVKANNDRYETLTGAEVEKQLAQLVDEFGRWLDDADKSDAAEDEAVGSSTPMELPPELADAKRRHELLKAIREQLAAADEARRKEGVDTTKKPAQLPSTDPDSKVLPNKEGGYAPNYTPLAAVDVHGDFIVYADVTADVAENTQTLAMVDQLKEDFGVQPQAVLADGLHATGPNIEGMEQRGVEFFSPMPGEITAGNPAIREDPTQPVPEEDWSKLPKNPQSKKLDKACFVYDEQANQYHCPMGRVLEFEKTKPETRQGQRITLYVYRSQSCAGCPLAELCVSEKNQSGRTISRDNYAKTRERHAAKMRTPEARQHYQRRFHPGETPFGWLKHILGMRQFLLRGLENVRMEWLWACTAHNMKKLVAAAGRLRAMVTQTLAAVEG